MDVHKELFLCIRLALTVCPTHFEGQTSPEASIPLISTIFVCYSKLFFGWSRFRRQKCKFLCGRLSWPCLCIRLALTARPTHLNGLTSPEASIPLISMIFICYRKLFFGWSEFRRQKCEIFLWTSVKTFSMHLVVPHGHSDPFWMSNEPQS